MIGWPENGERTYCICIPLYFVKAGAFDIFPFIYEKKKYEPIFICTSELFFKESHFAVALIV